MLWVILTGTVSAFVNKCAGTALQNRSGKAEISWTDIGAFAGTIGKAEAVSRVQSPSRDASVMGNEGVCGRRSASPTDLNLPCQNCGADSADEAFAKAYRGVPKT